MCICHLMTQISNLRSIFIFISLTIRPGLLWTLLEGFLLFGVCLCLVEDSVSSHVNMQEAPKETMTVILVILRTRYKPDSTKCYK